MAELRRSTASFDEWDRKEGTPGPMGVIWVPSLNAWNFALDSRRAAAVTLLLYAPRDQTHPDLEPRLNPSVNKSGGIWHCRVSADLAKGAAYYAYRVEGRRDRRFAVWLAIGLAIYGSSPDSTACCAPSEVLARRHCENLRYAVPAPGVRSSGFPRFRLQRCPL